MINLLYNTVFSGARTNKYRIIIPLTPKSLGTNDLSRDINTLCQSTSMPGKAVTATEAFVKGRKVMLRGETSLDSTWTTTILNTSDMIIRTELLQWMHEVHKNQWVPGGEDGLINDLAQGAKSVISGISNIVNDPMKFFTDSGVRYQKDVTIEQLNEKGEVEFTTTLIGAFPTDVSTVDLEDGTGDISKTVVTFTFNDIRYDSTSSPIDIDDITELGNAFSI